MILTYFKGTYALNCSTLPTYENTKFMTSNTSIFLTMDIYIDVPRIYFK